MTVSAARTLALLHPGAMGVTVGETLMAGGHCVRWLSEGRSAATRGRAENAGFVACASLSELLDGAQGVISVCPPEYAESVAGQVADAGFHGVYVDANAVAPATARRLADRLGPDLVDGGIIGPPANAPQTTRLYLCGSRAEDVAGWFSAGPLDAVVVDGPAGAASALKMCYAAYTKGSSALLLAVRALADAEGVASVLLEEWALSQPGLAERVETTARATGPKAWRFSGEMQEIAATFQGAALPDGFHLAAAEVYRRMAPLKGTQPDLDAVLTRLLARSE